MNQRVRYTEKQGILESVRTYHAKDTGNLRVQIHPVELRFLVLNDNNEVIATGLGGYLHEVKINAKKALTELGISFSEETRDRVDESSSNV